MFMVNKVLCVEVQALKPTVMMMMMVTIMRPEHLLTVSQQLIASTCTMMPGRNGHAILFYCILVGVNNVGTLLLK